jgi:hypothetical protein
MMNRTIICCAHPFGYGPAAKLLHIARELRARGLRLTFLGSGIAHELAARSELFDETVTAAPDDKQTRALIRDSAAMLSVMDRDSSALAIDLGRPLFVTDSLLWMRDQIPPVFRQAKRYWAQNFNDDQKRLGKVGPNALLVGPIVGPAPASAQQRRTRIVINLGGGETPGGLMDSHRSYCELVLRALTRVVTAQQRRGAVLLAGANSIRHLQDNYPNCGLEMVSANHDDALTLLRTAAWVVTAPGLTTCLECFQAGTPTFLLPPQNYSQWWILKKLRERGLARGAFHWEDLLAAYPITERMPEDKRGGLVRDAIQHAAGDRRAEHALVTGLGAVLESDSRMLIMQQHAFFDSLGSVGTGQIVNELLASVEE